MIFKSPFDWCLGINKIPTTGQSTLIVELATLQISLSQPVKYLMPTNNCLLLFNITAEFMSLSKP